MLRSAEGICRGVASGTHVSVAPAARRTADFAGRAETSAARWSATAGRLETAVGVACRRLVSEVNFDEVAGAGVEVAVGGTLHVGQELGRDGGG